MPGVISWGSKRKLTIALFRILAASLIPLCILVGRYLVAQPLRKMEELDTSYLVPGYVESYSLWVMPKGKTAEILRKEIKTLSAAYPPAPDFEPHVTLLPDIKIPGQDVIAKAKELASALQPYYVSFQNISRGSVYFQCVYLLCVKNEGTIHAGDVARKVYSMDTPPYMPHLSLLYSDIPAESRDLAAGQAHKRLYGEGSNYDTLLAETGFTVDSIAVWYTPIEDKSTASWRKIAVVPIV
ncbi:hypothetical protein CEUSTIGMA_g671.t1 [Chlamydomonas eustigma]|uniref:Cyclic phosphodiesterase n=1 Tax=Chlamydomonas eustigma TaxID=1157962 RepID=A0A250WQX1_9CHLO|nr:hypothetical protein CEUSTIGMA_g671.t1 [Chlamydomonas eustigma]|eukprot:GAX73218.1 hypothetical protein CEUSTIGMA_g671.t1 [Chlamydomonas eustigma]